MVHPFSLNSLLKQHRITLAGVVFLSVVESALFVAQFYFIGKAVNDLLKDSWMGVYTLIALFVAKVIVSFFKQKSISKTYKTLYDQLVADTVAYPLSSGEDMAKLAPKSTFIYVLTEFFKGDLIKGFETMVRLVFVLISLFLLNKIVFAIALGLAVVVFLLYFFRRKKTAQLSEDIATELLNEHQILEAGETDALFKHHEKLEQLDNKLLGISAINLSIIEVLSFAFTIVALVVLVKTDSENALGTFFTMLYYVMAFSETMFLLPSVYQKYVRTEALSKQI